VIDGPCSLILDQVANGVAVRMALLYLIAGAAAEERKMGQKRWRAEDGEGSSRPPGRARDAREEVNE
jgi:hypothetical protein